MKPVKTSVDHPIEVYFMDHEVVRAPGRIGMSIGPGKHDEDDQVIWQRDLDMDIKRLRDELGIDRLVCLLEEPEMAELGNADLLLKAEQAGMRTVHFPVDDHGKPASMQRFKEVVSSVTAAIDAGETVLIHCKGGRGRTGMLAAACLVEQGYTVETAIDTVRQYREGALTAAIKRDAVYEYAADN